MFSISSGSIEQLNSGEEIYKYCINDFPREMEMAPQKFSHQFYSWKIYKNCFKLTLQLKCLSVNWFSRNKKLAANSPSATYRSCLRRSVHQPLLSSQLGTMPEHPHPRMLLEAVLSPNWPPTIGLVPRIPIVPFVWATWRTCLTPTRVFTSSVLPVY